MTTTCLAALLAATTALAPAAAPLRPASAFVRDEVQDKTEKAQNVTGTWALAVEIAGGTGTPSLTLKQDGEKLTGTYSSQVFGDQAVTGTLKGTEIAFSFSVTAEGTTVSVAYTGTVDGDTMKGKVNLGELGDGTFTGKRK